MKKLSIVKIGGNVLDNAEDLEKFLADFSALEGAKILVHGGGKLATELAKQIGIEQTMVDGRRITDAETLKITVMVYAGLINKQVVAALQAKNTQAIGLSGADANVIQTTKRAIKQIDYGFVGDIDNKSVNANLLAKFLDLKLVPVFSAITHNGEGQLLNTNADTIASALAVAMAENYEVQLVYCFEKNGVLRNVEDENSVITTITKTTYKDLVNEGVIYKGMIPKLDNAFAAIENGVKAVRIIHANSLLSTTYDCKGTTLIA
jgi:acetylglutamate kinase